MESLLKKFGGLQPIHFFSLVGCCGFFCSPLFTSMEIVPKFFGLLVPFVLTCMTVIKGPQESGKGVLKAALVLPVPVIETSLSIWFQMILLFPFSFAIGFLLWWLTWGHNGEWVFVYISAVGLPGLAATLYSAFYLDSRASLLNPVLLAMITVLSLVVLDMASVIPLVCLAIVLGLGAISSFAVFRSYRSHLTAFYSLVEGLEKSDEAKSPECESNRESANFEYVPWWGTFLGKSSLPSSDNRDRYYPAILAIGLISLLPAVEFWPAAGLMGQIGAFTIVLGFYAMCFFGIIESSRLRVLKTLPQPRWHIALIDLVVRCLYLSGFALALVVLLVLMKRIDTLPEHLPRIIWLIGFIYPLAGFHFLAQERHLLRFIFTTLLISAIVLLGATGLLRNVLLGPSLILALLSCTFCTFLGLACFRFALTYSEVVDRGKGK